MNNINDIVISHGISFNINTTIDAILSDSPQGGIALFDVNLSNLDVSSLTMNDLFNNRFYQQNNCDVNEYLISIDVNTEAYNTALNYVKVINTPDKDLNLYSLFVNPDTNNSLQTRLLETMAIVLFGHGSMQAPIVNDTDFFNLNVSSPVGDAINNDGVHIFERYIGSGRVANDYVDCIDPVNAQYNMNFSGMNLYLQASLEGFLRFSDSNVDSSVYGNDSNSVDANDFSFMYIWQLFGGVCAEFNGFYSVPLLIKIHE